MRAPKNRRVFVVGMECATGLGRDLERTWEAALAGKAGYGLLTRCQVDCPSRVVGEIPDWDPAELTNPRYAKAWNAGFVVLTELMVTGALARAGLEVTPETGPRMACLIGSAINGHDAFRTAMENLTSHGPNRVSPYLLPNLCANVPAGQAGSKLGFTGPIFSPQGACASGNHAIGIGSRLIQIGDADFVLAGGVEMPLIPEIIVGFNNMNATFKLREGDRAYDDPAQASRPFSLDRKGFILSEGAGVVVLAAEEAVKAHGLKPIAEVLGVGWTSDANHFTRPNQETVVANIRMALADAGLRPGDMNYVNAHGTSTPAGDGTEAACLRDVFGSDLSRIPISSNKSQVGHSLGGAAAVEAVLTLMGMSQGVILPTINHLPDPELADLDVVPHTPRRANLELCLSNAFGFGGTNCTIIFRGV